MNQVGILRFFAPTRTKLAILVEWPLFLLYDLASSGFYWQRLRVLALPVAAYYLLACLLEAGVVQARRSTPLRVLAGLALVLALAEQGLKRLVETRLPVGAEISLIPDLLTLTHSQNLNSSWLAQQAGAGPWTVAAVALLSAVLLVFAVRTYRDYTSTASFSPWADLAFIFMAAGLLGALFDPLLRGFTLDFIGLPGLFAADFKDLYLSLGVGTVLAETLDNLRQKKKQVYEDLPGDQISSRPEQPAPD